MKLILLCLLICLHVQASDKPQIALQVDGDKITVIVRSKVQFSVWQTVTPPFWWRVYTSPVPAPGVEIVWIGFDDKANVFPAWSFWKVTAIKP